MYMAKKRVAMIKNEYYSPGMNHMHDQDNDFENINVQVSDALNMSERKKVQMKNLHFHLFAHLVR